MGIIPTTPAGDATRVTGEPDRTIPDENRGLTADIGDEAIAGATRVTGEDAEANLGDLAWVAAGESGTSKSKSSVEFIVKSPVRMTAKAWSQ